MRDAQSMLDQLVAFCGEQITEENVLEIFGFTSRETVAKLANNILTKNTVNALEMLHQQADSGKDLGQLLEDLIGCLRALLVSKVDPSADNDGIPQEFWDELQKSVESIQTDRLLNLVEIFAATDGQMKWATNKRLHLEIGVIKAIQSLNDARISDVITALGGIHDVSATINTESTAKATQTSPEKSETPSPQPQQKETPAPQEPVVQEQTEQTVTPQKEKTSNSNSIAGSLDKFIDQAEPGSTEPQAPALNPSPSSGPKPEAKKEEAKPEVETKTPDTSLDDEFQKDPLIEQAMKTFQASRISE